MQRGGGGSAAAALPQAPRMIIAARLVVQLNHVLHVDVTKNGPNKKTGPPLIFAFFQNRNQVI
jgi:hypothetical protein